MRYKVDDEVVLLSSRVVTVIETDELDKDSPYCVSMDGRRVWYSDEEIDHEATAALNASEEKDKQEHQHLSNDIQFTNPDYERYVERAIIACESHLCHGENAAISYVLGILRGYKP